MLRFADPGGRIYGAVGTSNANVLSHWGNIVGSGISLVGSGGRYTGTCIRLNETTNGVYLVKTLDSQSTWGIAFAFKTDSYPTSGIRNIAGFLDSNILQFYLAYTSSGNLSVVRNGAAAGIVGSGTTLAISSAVIGTNVWNHIEFKVTIHNTTGIYEVRLNGVSVIGPTSSANTRNSSSNNNSANQIAIGTTFQAFTPANHDFDDVIIYDGQTTDTQGNADITGPIGDCGAYWLLPSAAGSSTQFTPDSGSNYARVADTTVDTTSYVESSTVNNLDLYALTDAGASVSTVKSLQVIDYGRKTDTGSRGAKAVLRTGGTNYPHTNEMALSDSYLYYSSGWGTNPNTGVAWTPPDINSLEVGQKVSS